MRTKFLLCVTLMLGSVVTAQGLKSKTQDRASLTDQQTCYQQARQYVTDENLALQSKYGVWHFQLAHYESKTHTCYVQMSKDVPAQPGVLVYDILVVNAYEGKEIASFVGGMHQVGTEWSESDTTDCQVNGEKCSSRSAFNYLLWKLIPAFRPVTAKEAK